MKPPETLLERLRQRIASGLPIGFSPWRDADGVLWGQLLSFDARSITLRMISPIGQFEEERTYPISRISTFDFSEAYARKLQMLESFRSTKPEDGKWVRSASSRSKALTLAAGSDTVLNVQLRAEPFPQSIVVYRVEGNWADIAVLDDLCRDQNRYWIRRSTILAVQEHDAGTEAETWLREQLSSRES